MYNMFVQGFPGGLALKNLPAMQVMQETCVQSLGWEDPLEEGLATHCSILAWRIPWTKEPGGLQSKGSPRVGYDWSDLAQTHTQGQNKNYLTLKEPGKCNLLSKRKKIRKMMVVKISQMLNYQIKTLKQILQLCTIK